MASAILEMALSPFRPPLTRSASSDTTESTRSGETSSGAGYSDSSTPPTSAAYSESVASAVAKLDNANDIELDNGTQSNARATLSHPAPSVRLRRSRDIHLESYDIKIPSEPTGHAPRKFQRVEARDTNMLTRRRTNLGHDRIETSYDATEMTQGRLGSPTVSAIDTLDLQRPSKKKTKSWSRVNIETTGSPRRCKAAGRGAVINSRRVTRSIDEPIESLTTRLNGLRKRGRNEHDAALIKAKRELRRLADTNEYAKIDTQPVVAEIWSNGKLVTGQEPPTKRIRVEPAMIAKVDEDQKAVEIAKPKKRGPKVWLNKGLYAGQEARNLDWFAGYTKEERKKIASMPESESNGLLPLPLWHGQRLLHMGRDFKLPFDVCSPLPPGQPKPDEWRKVPKNRFVGDAAAAWKKSTVFDDFSSRCVCSPPNSCDESCQNRIMLYECDDGNCSAGPEHCTNRAFADLQERRGKGGKYRIGVEVIKTADRGYGVRSNRCFDPHQIIVEYTGEIITEEECDRRMNEVYKDNECYYLMLFDQNMIIDATRGSIARFVNHSCEPNCRMVKWIVAGKPRMALFAGDRPIMTGEELTYDYNFDPFSAKNVQQCRCGSEKCRGILGPRPKDKPKVPGTITESINNAVKMGKRKLEELLNGEENLERNPKKRKNATSIPCVSSSKALSSPKGFKRNTSNAASISTSRKSVLHNGSVKSKLLRTYGSKPVGTKKQNSLESSQNSSLAHVRARSGKVKGKGNVRGKGASVKMVIDGERSTVKVVRSIRKRTLSSKGRLLQGSKAAV